MMFVVSSIQLYSLEWKDDYLITNKIEMIWKETVDI